MISNAYIGGCTKLVKIAYSYKQSIFSKLRKYILFLLYLLQCFKQMMFLEHISKHHSQNKFWNIILKLFETVFQEINFQNLTFK